MWYPELIPVSYSYETGDDTLPGLSELVSVIPDPLKEIILDYLSTNCIIACSGLESDLLNPSAVIGSGSLYGDGRYIWSDCLTNYVRKYNIPLPEEFRDHLLEHYHQRKQRHAACQSLDSIRIISNPRPGCHYEIRISQSGAAAYEDLTGNSGTALRFIDRKDADWIIHTIIQQIFCYDTEDRGNAVIDGHHWRMEFYTQQELVYHTEGWNGEPDWRIRQVKDILEFVERYTQKELGSKYLDFEEPGRHLADTPK